jgi:hypothetical protein
MPLTRIKSQSILDKTVREQDLADGAVTFDKILVTDVGNPGDVLTVDAFGNLLFAPADGTAATLGSLADVNLDTGATQDQVLAFDTVSSEWRPITIAGVGATSNTYVVDNITQRDLLTPATGDSCFVRSGASGEYEQYVYDAAWILIATADSARTDANTAEAVVFFNTGSPVLIGNVSQDSRVTTVTVEVIAPFLSATGPDVPDLTATLTVGDVGDNERLLINDWIDLTEVGTYIVNADYIYTSAADTDVYAYFDFSNSIQGEARVIVTHV